MTLGRSHLLSGATVSALLSGPLAFEAPALTGAAHAAEDGQTRVTDSEAEPQWAHPVSVALRRAPVRAAIHQAP